MKHFFTFILFLTLVVSVSSQALITPSSEWYYSTGNDFANGYIHVFYNQDTIIEGNEFMQFNRHYEALDFMDEVTIYTGELPPIYYLANEDQVFLRYADGPMHLLYDMTLNVGDSLTTYSDSTMLCAANGVSVVDSVGVMNIAGQNYRYLYLRTVVITDDLYSNFDGYVIERIGGMSQGLPVEYGLCHSYQTFGLRCFNETNFMYINPDFNQACDFVVGIEELSKHPLEIYPNPNQGVFRLELPEGEVSEIRIYNVAGAVVLRKNNVRNRIISLDLSDQAKGLYMIQLISHRGGVQVAEVVIR